eukprot:scaffold822_cov130-Cylindrotheca_fusiformis.AAC.3
MERVWSKTQPVGIGVQFERLVFSIVQDNMIKNQRTSFRMTGMDSMVKFRVIFMGHVCRVPELSSVLPCQAWITVQIL